MVIAQRSPTCPAAEVGVLVLPVTPVNGAVEYATGLLLAAKVELT